MSRLEGWFDGVCEPRNPGGHAAWGALLKLDGKVIWSAGGYCGVGPRMSNNVAEYSGALALLEHTRTMPGALIIRGDSKLVICQLSGRWKIHGGLYVPFYRKALALTKEQRRFRNGNLTFIWIPRDKNSQIHPAGKRSWLAGRLTQ